MEWWAGPSCAASSASPARSEEHTSELQSRLHLVCRLLLEKKKGVVPTPSATVVAVWRSRIPGSTARHIPVAAPAVRPAPQPPVSHAGSQQRLPALRPLWRRVPHRTGNSHRYPVPVWARALSDGMNVSSIDRPPVVCHSRNQLEPACNIVQPPISD